MNNLQVEHDDEKEKKPKIKYIICNDEDDEKPKHRKEKKMSPEYVFVFDDLGAEMRNPAVNLLLKTNRHYRCKVILSSQYVNDLMPESLKQIDYFLLFGGHSIDKLEKIYKDADLPVTFDLFLQLYKNATENKFNFLYIDTRDIKFRKNFNVEYQM